MKQPYLFLKPFSKMNQDLIWWIVAVLLVLARGL